MRICYFGIYGPSSAPRDKVYVEGLKMLGVEFLECVDSLRSFWKFWALFKKHRSIRNDYDIMWVGYLSGTATPLAKLISKKKVIFNALNSMYESNVLDQKRYGRFSPKAIAFWCADFLAFHMSDVILVESEQQKEFLSKMFWINKSKLYVVFSSIDGEIFHPNTAVNKKKKFTVIFRGWFANATGAEYILEAAKILKRKMVDIDIIMIGRGQRQNEIKKTILDDNLSNVQLIMDFLPPKKLRDTMLSAHVMLGQFSPHSRMDRTIQYKTLEAMALGMPYITRDSMSNRELLTEGVNCIFARADDPQDIVDKILELKNNESLRKKISAGARDLYEAKLTPAVLGRQVMDILKSF